MPRRNSNTRPTTRHELNFRELCYRLGVTPKQRVKLIKYLKERQVNLEPLLLEDNTKIIWQD